MDKNYNVEMIIYGKLELMVMKYCPLKKNLDYCSKCMDNKDKFYLEDRYGELFPITRENCLTHIMQSKNIDKISNIDKYMQMGICNYRLELFDEDYAECEKLIKKVRYNLNK